MKMKLLNIVAVACAAALQVGAVPAECARIFEAEIRDGVIHGAVVVVGSQCP